MNTPDKIPPLPGYMFSILSAEELVHYSRLYGTDTDQALLDHMEWQEQMIDDLDSQRLELQDKVDNQPLRLVEEKKRLQQIANEIVAIAKEQEKLAERSHALHRRALALLNEIEDDD